MTFLSFPFYIARRYLLSKGEPRFASFLTVIAIFGVAAGVSALIVVISVMVGFGNDLESKLMGFNPHVTVMMPASGSGLLPTLCHPRPLPSQRVNSSGDPDQIETLDSRFRGNDMQYRGNDMQYRGNDMQYRGNNMQYRGNDILRRNDMRDCIMSNFKGIKEIEPFLTGEAIVASGMEGSNVMGGKILGIERIPERLLRTAKFYWGGGIDRSVWWHKFMPPLKRGVVLGNEMLYQIGVHPDFGDRVQLITPFGGIDPLGNPAPVTREYRVTGGFKSGFFEYDVKYVLMPLVEAKKLLGAQGRSGLQIMLVRPERAASFVKELQKFLGPSYEVSGWAEKNKKLFAALRLEKLAMTCLLFLIIIIASFSVVGVTLMIFFSKRRDIAMLVAMGASRRKIEGIFLYHGGLIGLAGSLLGSAIALLLCLVIKRGNIVLPQSYYLERLPVSLDAGLFFLVALGGILISLAAAYYPARRAAEMEPLELLRYE